MLAVITLCSWEILFSGILVGMENSANILPFTDPMQGFAAGIQLAQVVPILNNLTELVQAQSQQIRWLQENQSRINSTMENSDCWLDAKKAADYRCSRIAATSCANLSPRRALALSNTPITKRSYASSLSKSRLPRSSRCCSSRLLKCPCITSQVPFSFGLLTLVVRGVISSHALVTESSPPSRFESIAGVVNESVFMVFHGSTQDISERVVYHTL